MQVQLGEHVKEVLFANPCYTQIHPTCIPVHGDYPIKTNSYVRKFTK